MNKRRKVTVEKEYQGHPILTDKEHGLGCDVKILESVKRTLDSALEDHSRVMLFRYDVRLPEGVCPDSNAIFSSSQADFVKYLKRNDLDPRYVAVREESSSKPHYHVAMLVDNNKTRSPYYHLKKINAIVTSKVGAVTGDYSHTGLVDYCDKDPQGSHQSNTHIIHRNDPESYDDAFQRSSYLAKVNTKPSKGQRELFGSKLRKNNADPGNGQVAAERPE